MNRLPEKFEKTVLSKHGIVVDIHSRVADEMVTGTKFFGYLKQGIIDPEFVTDYEIAAIGLEAMNIVCIPLSSGDRWQISIQSSWTIVEDRDFCTCINRAIIEIYGTKEEKDAANKKL